MASYLNFTILLYTTSAINKDYSLRFMCPVCHIKLNREVSMFCCVTVYSYLDLKEGRLFLEVIALSIVALWFRGHSYLPAGDLRLCSLKTSFLPLQLSLARLNKSKRNVTLSPHLGS